MSSSNNNKTFIRILAIKINLINVINHNQFSNSILFDIKKSEIYVRVMQSSHIVKCTQIIDKKLDILYKNKMWALVHQDKMEISYRTLRHKWIYKVKQDIKEKVVCFKAR